MLKRALLSAYLSVVLMLVQPQQVEAAAVISVGTPFIPITADTFAVPIEITGGVSVTAWSFGLSYDPADWTINTNCDPIADIYCGFDNGPITEGAYFSAGAPFNILCCGIIELDPSTFEQIGVLIGVNGSFGGPSPYPAGNGILAYVEFVSTPNGTGDSKIQVTDSSVTSSTVPEPTTLALLAAGLVILARLRRRQDFGTTF